MNIMLYLLLLVTNQNGNENTGMILRWPIIEVLWILQSELKRCYCKLQVFVFDSTIQYSVECLQEVF